MLCSDCEYREFCKAAHSSICCGDMLAKLDGREVNSLKEFCDIAVKSKRGYEKYCKWCCENFVAEKFDEEFCSKKCKAEQKAYLKRREKRHKNRRIRCVNCGEPLLFGESYCSPSCRAEYERKMRSKRNVK